MAGFVGLTFKDSIGITRRTKFRWHTAELQQRIGAGSAVALQKVGLDVRRNTQRGMVGGSTRTGRKPSSAPKWWKVGEKDGYPVVAYVTHVPRPDKVSSWAPTAFLRNDVQADYDPSTKSVVIGPSKVPWLNQLHEFGGSVRVYVRHGKFPVQTFAGKKVPRKLQATRSVLRSRSRRGIKDVARGAYVGVFSNTSGNFNVGTRGVRGRGYMETGLQQSMSKIPEKFKGLINYGTVRPAGRK
jgi:hypothetical protein